MSHRQTQRIVPRMPLFEPPPKRPGWAELPAPLQQQIVEILSRLLSNCLLQRQHPHPRKKGPAHE